MSTETAFILLSVITMGFALLAFYMGKIWLIAFTAICLLLANIVGPKIVSIYGFAITAGTPIFAALPLATDLLTERYGKSAARMAVFMAFFGMMFFIAISFFVLELVTLDFAADSGAAVDKIFSSSLRLMIASPTAYLIWQMVDIWVYHQILRWTSGRMLWLRNNVSTVIAQAGSTYTFFFFAFYGVNDAWMEIATVSVLFYWVIAALDTIIVYLSKLVHPRDLA